MSKDNFVTPQKEEVAFSVKESKNCSTVDQFGFTRPVFTDRICDNRADCPNNEDETGLMAQCLPSYGLKTYNNMI